MYSVDPSVSTPPSALQDLHANALRTDSPNLPATASSNFFHWHPQSQHTNGAISSRSVQNNDPMDVDMRAQIQTPQNNTVVDSSVPHTPCPACSLPHPRGSCPLKIAGVEFCPLCGLAHFGTARTCPHINSETQVREMLAALKSSPERKELVAEAHRYLSGVKGTLVRHKKVERQKKEYERGRGGELDRESGVQGFGYLAQAAGFGGNP